MSDSEFDEDEYSDFDAVTPVRAAKPRRRSIGSVEKTYQKKNPIEHILARPDTYIGSTEARTETVWLLDSSGEHMAESEVTYSPGLYKLFDEVLVNAADNQQRDPEHTTLIEVTINTDDDGTGDGGSITVKNNGRPIPIKEHKEHKLWVPEMVFGTLLTGSNYDDTEKRTTGGRNGYGAKLTNVFSSKFVVEVGNAPWIDSKGRSEPSRRYKQTWTANMGKKTKASVRETKTSDFVKVSFWPDWAKFDMDRLRSTDALVAVLSKRVHDLAGILPTKCRVKLNGSVVKTNSFKKYLDLYKTPERAMVHQRFSDRWEVAVCASEGSFQHVSFVNCVSTPKGGTHVKHVSDQLVKKIVELMNAKKKHKTQVKPSHVKNHLFVFVNCLVDNPAFQSQTKEELSSAVSKFGVKCDIPDDFVKKAMKLVESEIAAFATMKEQGKQKKSDGKKTSRITGIPKLEDANFAGTRKARDCTLILTEGDSAKALAMAGLSEVGRDYYGVFPLKGKLLNVRGVALATVNKNEEISNIKKILGLQHKADYSKDDVFNKLRYGHLMIMADQDHDGSHIKGLVVNFIHHNWPALIRRSSFLQQFITPIVVCRRGAGTRRAFYTLQDFDVWKDADPQNGSVRGWKVKYYKGLGTSTSAEGKSYFRELSTHKKLFQYVGPMDDEAIKLAFDKKRADARKDWLRASNPDLALDYARMPRIPYHEFVNKELVHFSRADCVRSIPSMVDGFKPGQRKILFSCFKRNLRSDIKIAQLAGYVSEHSAYHHGELSLNASIVGMAQNFCGSNNIALLVPSGQFGTRNMGGKDHASPRYVFTRLAKITRAIFPAVDDTLLEYNDDDGQFVEPKFYMPILPMVLVNGSDGIGTGFSSNVPNYNPRDVVAYLQARLEGAAERPRLEPFYSRWTGEIAEKTPGAVPRSFESAGRVTWTSETELEISELPVREWTLNYRTRVLEKMVEQGVVDDIRVGHTDDTVRFFVQLNAKHALPLEEDPDALEKAIRKEFRLTGSISEQNMILFNAEGELVSYESPERIADDFYRLRLEFYVRRKNYLIVRIGEELAKLSDQARFILAVVSGELKVSNRPKAAIIKDLVEMGFRKFPQKGIVLPEEYLTHADAMRPLSGGGSAQEAADADADDALDGEAGGDDDKAKGRAKISYSYLLSMPIWSLTLERVEELQASRNDKDVELGIVKARHVKDMWREELDAFLKVLDDHEAEVVKSLSTGGKKKKSGKAFASASKLPGSKSKKKQAQLQSKAREGKISTPKKSVFRSAVQHVLKEEKREAKRAARAAAGGGAAGDRASRSVSVSMDRTAMSSSSALKATQKKAVGHGDLSSILDAMEAARAKKAAAASAGAPAKKPKTAAASAASSSASASKKRARAVVDDSDDDDEAAEQDATFGDDASSESECSWDGGSGSEEGGDDVVDLDEDDSPRPRKARKRRLADDVSAGDVSFSEASPKPKRKPAAAAASSSSKSAAAKKSKAKLQKQLAAPASPAAPADAFSFSSTKAKASRPASSPFSRARRPRLSLEDLREVSTNAKPKSSSGSKAKPVVLDESFAATDADDAFDSDIFEDDDASDDEYGLGGGAKVTKPATAASKKPKKSAASSSAAAAGARKPLKKEQTPPRKAASKSRTVFNVDSDSSGDEASIVSPGAAVAPKAKAKAANPVRRAKPVAAEKSGSRKRVVLDDSDESGSEASDAASPAPVVRKKRPRAAAARSKRRVVDLESSDEESEEEEEAAYRTSVASAVSWNPDAESESDFGLSEDGGDDERPRKRRR